jgi:predicted nucleic acid-binding protein
MSRAVFVDTSAWIAASNTRDKYHNVAAAEYRRLLSSRSLFVTTNLVIAETYIIILRNGGHPRAMHFLQSLRSSPRLERVYSDDNLEILAESILDKHVDQDFSYTDAVSFSVMQQHGLHTDFTFDNHFATLGFEMLPA